ncbi:MAG: tetratricopeptide repeat protein [Gemmatimonadetes bacterium]|jgi:tetratricopeptide (TPR) repeat protein|nr:tetratricopeptide repeat protein [Gemmatimonadota bacterium]
MRLLLYATLVCLGLVACRQDLTGDEWHQRAQGLIGDRDPRELEPRELARAEYCEAQALVQDSTLTAAAYTLAALYRARGSFAEATKVYRQLLEQNSEQGRAYIGLGLSLASQGRYNGAMRAYQDAIRRGERSTQVYTLLGHVYQALGHRRENLLSAEASYRAALESDPDQPEVLFQLARVLVRLERPQEAMGLSQQALRLAPEDIGIRVEQSALWKKLGQRQSARGVLAQGLTLETDEVAVLHLELGRLLWEEGANDRALDQFQRALARDASLGYAYRYMGSIYSRRGQLDKALEVYLRLEERWPDDAAVKVSIGILYSQQGDMAAAEKMFKEALALGGSGGDAAVKLGGLYVHQRRYAEGIKAYKSGLERFPNNGELHASLGDVSRHLGMLSAALDAGREAVRLEPEKALWHFHLAATYERLDPEMARKTWERYIELAAGEKMEAQRLTMARNRLRALSR